MSTPVQGVITEMKFYLLNKDGSANQWGKTHRCKATINGTIYDLGTLKASPRGDLEMRVQNGKDWVTLLAGDTVQFFAKSREHNGKTYWDKEGKVALTAKGNGVPAPQPATQAPVAKAASPAKPSDPYANPDPMQVRITDGQVFNIASDLVIGKGMDYTLENITAAAATVRKVREQWLAGGAGRGNEQAASPAPVASPVAATQAPASVVPTAASGTPAPSVVTSTAATAEFDEDDVPFK